MRIPAQAPWLVARRYHGGYGKRQSTTSSVMWISKLFFAMFALMIVSCAQRQEALRVVRADALENSLGQRVALVGVAEPRKLGAALRCDGFDVWIDGLNNWPSGYADRRVEVVGVLEERRDLPVFVQKPGTLPVQGIPVPEGTDLNEASHRYVVRKATWKVLP